MAQVSVTIDGKTYRMSCDEGQEEHLIDLAGRFDRYVGHLKGSFGEIGDHRLAVMAGIMVMDEFSELEKPWKSISNAATISSCRSARLPLGSRSSFCGIAEINWVTITYFRPSIENTGFRRLPGFGARSGCCSGTTTRVFSSSSLVA